jgi:hypothetical protein
MRQVLSDFSLQSVLYIFLLYVFFSFLVITDFANMYIVHGVIV